MDLRAGRWARWAGAAGLALLAVWLPVAADPGESVTTADGTLLSVWVVKARGPGETRGAPPGSSIGYSATAPAGAAGEAVVGVVPPTADPASDLSPRLAVDPSSGATALVWSRFDGVYDKIVYARYEAGAWVDFHDLTFGPGDDIEPRLAVSDRGSFLFWVSSGRYLYAPIDLALGHLLAPPRTLRFDGLRPAPPAAYRGGSDAPIVWGSRKITVWNPGNPTAQGGQDVPIVGGNKGQSILWGAASKGRCGEVVLVVPFSSGLLGVFSFVNGTTASIARVPIPAVTPAGYADAVAAAYLLPGCN